MKNIPAFPNNFTIERYQGLTIRDYFAAKAMQGLLASDVYASKDKFAENAYAMADAMMKARSECVK